MKKGIICSSGAGRVGERDMLGVRSRLGRLSLQGGCAQATFDAILLSLVCSLVTNLEEVS